MCRLTRNMEVIFIHCVCQRDLFIQNITHKKKTKKRTLLYSFRAPKPISIRLSNEEINGWCSLNSMLLVTLFFKRICAVYLLNTEACIYPHEKDSEV